MQYCHLIAPPPLRRTAAIDLVSSKSLSNRALLIRALCRPSFDIHNLSSSEDTQHLSKALQQIRQAAPPTCTTLDIGAAGTAFRFLCAYCAATEGEYLLTGDERLRQRPIAPLVDALRQLGASIKYTEKENFAPLHISGKPLQGGTLHIAADVSSQFISALLLIAPTLQSPLKICGEGKMVSEPYIEMTLQLQRYFGIEAHRSGNEISIVPQTYQARPYTVENDWSAASYWYAIAALRRDMAIEIPDLLENSWQGDSHLTQWAEKWGVKSVFTNHGSLRLYTPPTLEQQLPALIELDMLDTPDIAPTVAVLLAALRREAFFYGLQTLELKESKRCSALHSELSKIGYAFEPRATAWHLHPTAAAFDRAAALPTFATHRDHRMAMAFAPLALCFPRGVRIENPAVAGKSYPDFWNDLQRAGFEVRFV